MTRRVPANVVVSACAILVLLGTGTGGAADWSATEAQLLWGSGFFFEPDDREIITFSHVSGWSRGTNFFFIDVTKPFGDGTDLYGEWYTRFSLNRLRGRQDGSGPVRDLSLAAAINAGDGFRAYLAGATVHFSVPGFALFDLDLMAYDDRNDSDVTYIVTPIWDTPFSLGRLHLRFRGFIDIIGAEGTRTRQLLAQPQLLLDAGSLAGSPDRLLLGFEYHYWDNRYGIEGADESILQALLVWIF